MPGEGAVEVPGDPVELPGAFGKVDVEVVSPKQEAVEVGEHRVQSGELQEGREIHVAGYLFGKFLIGAFLHEAGELHEAPAEFRRGTCLGDIGALVLLPAFAKVGE